MVTKLNGVVANYTIQQVVDCVWEDKLAVCKIYQKIFESGRPYTFSELFSICEQHCPRFLVPKDNYKHLETRTTKMVKYEI